jgi:hypothetical protein
MLLRLVRGPVKTQAEATSLEVWRFNSVNASGWSCVLFVAMDRTDEFVSLLGVLGYQHWHTQEQSVASSPHISEQQRDRSFRQELSPLQHLALNISKSIQQNRNILRRIDKLYVSLDLIFVYLSHSVSRRTQRKEFSNDPTSEINENSEMFQLKLVTVKKEMEILKININSSGRGTGSHQQQHWNHILSYLQKKVSEQIESFQVDASPLTSL